MADQLTPAALTGTVIEPIPDKPTRAGLVDASVTSKRSDRTQLAYRVEIDRWQTWCHGRRYKPGNRVVLRGPVATLGAA